MISDEQKSLTILPPIEKRLLKCTMVVMIILAGRRKGSVGGVEHIDTFPI